MPHTHRYFAFSLMLLLVCMCCACSGEKEHTAPPIYPQDSVPMMTSYGVNTLISDSGIIKYRIVTEKWEVNPNRNPSRWTFDQGLLLEQFDQTLHIQSYIQCDTAYYFDQNRLWELHGRVRILTKNGLRYSSEELFWDELRHEIYSNRFSRLVTPERELQGDRFRSNETMTKYDVSNSKGSFAKDDLDSSPKKPKASSDTTSTVRYGRNAARPGRKRNTTTQ